MVACIIHQLKQYYDTVVRSQYFPQEIGQLCQYDLEQFELRVNGIVNDLQMQILRLETLLRLFRNRKSLVSQIAQSVQNFELRHDQLHSILELQNTEANKQSTKSMIAMTRDMNEIARQTKIETVSMKVITVVTLFFCQGLLSPSVKYSFRSILGFYVLFHYLSVSLWRFSSASPDWPLNGLSLVQPTSKA